MIEFELIEAVPNDSWDTLILEYHSPLFHCSAWTKFLEETQGAKTLRFRIVQEGHVLGYFTALLVKKGPFQILGSPLSGWETEEMGPILSPGSDIETFIEGLDRLCRRIGIHQIEIGSPILEPSLMARHGYSVSKWNSFIIPLSADREKMWGMLKSKCRNRIRKGLKNGLVVEDCECPSFVHRHYEQLLDVYAKQELSPAYSPEFYMALHRNLKPCNMLFSLEVKYKTNVIASGFFSHDERAAYSLSTASYRKFQSLYPNELLHWALMCFAGELGIQKYNIGDSYRNPETGGKFKEKFNGVETAVYRYIKSFSPLAKIAREAYRIFLRRKQKSKWTVHH
jgi:hypothetical protein